MLHYACAHSTPPIPQGKNSAWLCWGCFPSPSTPSPPGNQEAFLTCFARRHTHQEGSRGSLRRLAPRRLCMSVARRYNRRCVSCSKEIRCLLAHNRSLARCQLGGLILPSEL